MDPLTAKYPWNSSYAFSESRVIDGVELEGLEYLWYNESLIEMQKGDLYIKMENLNHNTVSQLIDQNGISSVFLTNYEVKNSPLLISNNVFEIEKNTYKQPKGLKKVVESNLVQFGAEGKGLLISFAAINFTKFLVDSYISKVISDDISKLDKQLNSFEIYDKASGKILNKNFSVFDKVKSDIKKAIKKGLIPKELMNKESIGALMNIVLFGGNGNEDEKVRDVGQKILDEITGDQRGEAPVNTYLPLHTIEAKKKKKDNTKKNKKTKSCIN